MTNKEKELFAENEELKKEIKDLKERIERYREMEVELSTTIDLLRGGIKWDIFKIYIYVTVILTFKKGLILMKKADK